MNWTEEKTMIDCEPERHEKIFSRLPQSEVMGRNFRLGNLNLYGIYYLIAQRNPCAPIICALRDGCREESSASKFRWLGRNCWFKVFRELPKLNLNTIDLRSLSQSQTLIKLPQNYLFDVEPKTDIKRIWSSHLIERFLIKLQTHPDCCYAHRECFITFVLQSL